MASPSKPPGQRVPPPPQLDDTTRIDDARNVGTAPALPDSLPLLVPTAAVVPLVPVAGFAVAG
jgi:hypothetical protein